MKKLIDFGRRHLGGERVWRLVNSPVVIAALTIGAVQVVGNAYVEKQQYLKDRAERARALNLLLTEYSQRVSALADLDQR